MDQDGMMDGELMEIAGRKHEMSTEGGEVNFVAKIIAESHKLSNIKIFTAMLGRKKSANILKQTLKSDKLITSLAVSEFCQGTSLNNYVSMPEFCTYHRNCFIHCAGIPHNYWMTRFKEG